MLEITKQNKVEIAISVLKRKIENLEFQKNALEIDANPFDYAEEKREINNRIYEFQKLLEILEFDKEYKHCMNDF
jgi:hypothetical protein